MLNVPGIPDEAFLRDKVPMTKEEVRVVTLSKLRLQEEDIIYDIGAGTGSISIESALLLQKGRVYAIERNPVALELIQRNKERFGCENLEIIGGLAPQALEALPSPTKVIIGGSGGNLTKILDTVDEKLPRGGRVVINAIALETLATAIDYYKRKNSEKISYSLEIIQLSVSKAEFVAGLNMMKGSNPIYIITAEKASNK